MPQIKIDFNPLKEGLSAGDRVEVTVGRQVFNPEKYCSFEVGPVRVSVTVREGESGAEAYVRASTAAQTMFESEYQITRDLMAKRLKENEW